MQNLSQLTSLERSLRNARVLSVYLDGTATDPAQQRTWRTRLEQSIADLREWLGDSPHAEREEFEQCVQLLVHEVARLGSGVGAPGWVAFITATRVPAAQALPVAMPTRAFWSTGASIGPYLRALKEHRAVIVAVVDSRRANLYRYQFGALRRVTTVRAHHAVREPSHMGAAPSRGFHSGTHGETGHDAAQRGLREGRHRMLDQAAHRIESLAGPNAWVLIGGIPEAAHELTERLSTIASSRVAHFEGLDVHATPAELRSAARSAASALREDMERMEIAGIADHEAAQGVAALGPADTRRTLDEARVRVLYLTHRYLDDHAFEAEDAVRAAIRQGAVVEEVSGRAAALLDGHGGMAARLRYRSA
ncbi:MAG: hypothetical protein ACRENU_04865 [Gemmatimonadaceae bacterium]